MRDEEGGELADSKTDDGSAVGSTTKNKFHPAEVYVGTRVLRQARRDADEVNESRKVAQTVTANARAELAAAKKTVKDLTHQIEESTAQIGIRKLAGECSKSDQDLVIGELERIKRESSKLKLDIASVLEERRRAEKEKDYYASRAESWRRSVEVLSKEIAERNEEHVLVELARIEAVKEYEQVEARRREKAQKHLAAMEEAWARKQSLIQEIQVAEDLERQLAVTVSDVNVLASELKLVKEMNEGLERSGGEANSEEQQDETLGLASLLCLVMKELEAAKKELAAIKEGSFHLMASMDVVRREHAHIQDKIARLKEEERKSEMTIQHLNSNLLRAKAKLEAATAAEDKAKSIAWTQSLMLEQLQSEAEAAMKEHSLITEETTAAKEDLRRKENAMALADDRLHTALQELQAAKFSEAAALENLKVLTEKTMQSRDSASLHISRITISRFEYEYLTGPAAGAKDIADKKVAAAEAWIEALRASEKEIQIRYELLQKQSSEFKAQEGNELKNRDGSINEKEENEINEFEEWRIMGMGTEKLDHEIGFRNKSRKSKSTKISSATARRGKARTSASPVVRGGSMSRSTSFTVKRRRKVMPNLAKFFRRESSERIQ